MSLLPTLFVSHGAPTLLYDDCPAHDFLLELGRTLPRSQAILCVSAHWETAQPTLTGAARPETIHDFYGFSERLYQAEYPAPAYPELAQRIAGLLQDAGLPATVHPRHGFDHGAWVPLKLMYPAADIPVIQLSVQPRLPPEHHLRLGQILRPLRSEGVLILGSGSATHHLAAFRGQPLDTPPLDYVVAFDTWLEQAITQGDTAALLAYMTAPHARRNHPTPEHFLPLFAPLGAANPPGCGRLLHRSFTYGILAMAAYAWD